MRKAWTIFSICTAAAIVIYAAYAADQAEEKEELQ